MDWDLRDLIGRTDMIVAYVSNTLFSLFYSFQALCGILKSAQSLVSDPMWGSTRFHVKMA